MVKCQTLFGSGYRMVGTGLICQGFFPASLDRFGTNKIFFMTLISKAVKASESGFQMVGTGPICLAFKW